MKKILLGLSIFFIFLQGVSGSNIDNEIQVKYMENKFDFLYFSAMENLESGNIVAADDFIFRYLNKAGFKDCNVFKYFNKKKTDIDYEIYLNSCNNLMVEFDFKSAYQSMFEGDYREENNDLILLYKSTVADFYGDTKKRDETFKQLSEDNLFPLFVNYSKLKFSIGTPDVKTLLEEDYRLKKYAIYILAFSDYDQKKYAEALKKAYSAFEYENHIYNTEITGQWLSFHHQMVHLILLIYREQGNSVDYVNFLHKYINEYQTRNIKSDNYIKHYKLFNDNLLNKDIFGEFFFEETKNKENYLLFLNSLDKEDREIIELYMDLFFLGDQTEEEKRSLLLLDKIYCSGSKNIFINDRGLMDKFKVIDTVEKYKWDIESLGKECKKIKDILIINEDNNKNLLYIFLIGLLMVLGILFYNNKFRK